jgi:cholesterol transport system auxiliary component
MSTLRTSFAPRMPGLWAGLCAGLRWSRLGVLASLVMLLGGCAAIELASGLATREPPRLYRLSTPDLDLPALPRRGATLSIEVPTAAAGLNSSRIALRPTPTSLQYYADANWAEVVPVMVHALLVESLEDVEGLDIVGRDLVGVRVDFALLTDIREFQVDYREGAEPEVRLRMQTRLVRLPRRSNVASTTVERHVTAADRTIPTIVAGFDAAFAEIADDLARWLIEELGRAVR